jgi:hypothetical protein
MLADVHVLLCVGNMFVTYTFATNKAFPTAFHLLYNVKHVYITQQLQLYFVCGSIASHANDMAVKQVVGSELE